MTIFAFGSNESGQHLAGAAHAAFKHHGARWGVGFGHQGDSFAIPTKDTQIQTLPIQAVAAYVDQFIEYATDHPEFEFQVTRIGCGLAGFTDSEIAPLFIHAPSNCLFDTAWKPYLPTARFWGTF